MKTILASTLAVVLALAIQTQRADAHCQVPCGIYDDHARVHAMIEDADTVIKATTMLAELEDQSNAQAVNQKVRWVTNKEIHAQKIIATMADYFLTQRVKPDAEDYAERLQKHHAVILAAMKAKQNAATEHGEALKAAIEAIAPYYPEG